ncbi:MAG: transglycosylase SLT domain-containing protein [Gemmatimonadetes bacterium]|nr:transglycosylase SLT domain-containing protein [Gemmatimonadota bacterium]
MAQLRGPLGVTVRLLAVAAATWVCAAPLAAQSDSASGGNLAERSRLARSLAAEGRTGMALEVVDELAVRAPRLADWTALAVADTLATQGDTRAVRRATSLIGDLRIQRRARRLEADAWAHAGESARALEAVLELAANDLDEEGPASPGALLSLEWRLRLAIGDSVGAVAAMERLLRLEARSPDVHEAAMAHWRVAEASGPEALRLVARGAAAGSEYGTAVNAWRLAERRGATLTERELMELARAHRGSGDSPGAAGIYEDLARSAETEIASAALAALAGLRARQGRRAEAEALRRELLERFPAHPDALDVLFFRATDQHGAGRLDDAITGYRSVVSASPSANRAGLAWMRWAQIHLGREEWGAALEIFGGYLVEFPSGRRWEEASYWGAFAARQLGRDDLAERLLARLLSESPLSYYALLAAELEGREFAPALPAGEDPVEPPWLAAEIELLSLLEEAGLHDGVEAQLALVRGAVQSSDGHALALASALIAGGHVLGGIRLGLEVRERGRRWDMHLARIVYPFPYRALIEARAHEAGVDPYLVAGLIRQESAFEPAIASGAGAVGLMQIMPATGRNLAAGAGISGFHTADLETPEVNVRLGTDFLATLLDRYDGHLPLALSAYNAGPTRANRWRQMPEASDPHRFTERIPFAETREYVRRVTRNRALYRWLYGTPG